MHEHRFKIDRKSSIIGLLRANIIGTCDCEAKFAGIVNSIDLEINDDGKITWFYVLKDK